MQIKATCASVGLFVVVFEFAYVFPFVIQIQISYIDWCFGEKTVSILLRDFCILYTLK